MTAVKNVKVKTLTGKVTSDKRDKTRTVVVEWSIRHPLFEKVMKRNTKLHVHDANNTSVLGDTVTIKECRPISKTKSWELVSVISAAN